MSFSNTAYIPCLELSIASDLFILYHNKAVGDASLPHDGCVLEVVSSIDMVPRSKNFPSI